MPSRSKSSSRQCWWGMVSRSQQCLHLQTRSGHITSALRHIKFETVSLKIPFSASQRKLLSLLFTQLSPLLDRYDLLTLLVRTITAQDNFYPTILCYKLYYELHSSIHLFIHPFTYSKYLYKAPARKHLVNCITPLNARLFNPAQWNSERNSATINTIPINIT